MTRENEVTELAPEECIVCGKPKPTLYLAGAVPVGSMACSADCAEVAIERFMQTGRCDARGEKS